MASISGGGVKRGGVACGAAGVVVAGGVCENSGLEIEPTRTENAKRTNPHFAIDWNRRMGNLNSSAHPGGERERSKEYRFTLI
jgi:hypothetical protein